MSDMKTTCQFNNPDQMDVTITTTMTLYNWRKLRDELKALPILTYQPAFQLRREIEDVIGKVEKTFIPNTSTPIEREGK